MDGKTAIEVLQLSAARHADGTETAKALQHAIQAIEALERVREVSAELARAIDSTNFSGAYEAMYAYRHAREILDKAFGKQEV